MGVVVAMKMCVVQSRPLATTWPMPTRLYSGRSRLARWPAELTNAWNSVASLLP